MNKEDYLRLLSKVDAFSGLSAADLETILGKCEIQTFESGAAIVQERQPVLAFHILAKGELRVMLPGKIAGTKERRVTDVRLNKLGPGDCFGEYGLIDGQPASASVVALQPGFLLKLSADSFERLLAVNDRMAKMIYRNLLRLLIARLRKREKEYD